MILNSFLAHFYIKCSLTVLGLAEKRPSVLVGLGFY